MFKLGMSLVFSVVAALVIMLVGLASDARFVTIALRCLVGFLVAGAAVYLVALVLEAKDIIGFDKNLELEEIVEGEAPLNEAATGDELGENAADASMEETEGTGTGFAQEGNDGFHPLDEHDFRHVETPVE